MKIAVLTSSRADYSIYYPLLIKIQKDTEFSLHLIVFGTHLSSQFGLTVEQIKQDGFKIDHQIVLMPNDDSPKAISQCMGLTVAEFSKVWEKSDYDIIFCLGDRYEMFAAAAAAVAFNKTLAHIHGGETTLGAIDNVFRHSISLMSRYHYVTTDEYKNRIQQIINSDEHIYNVGALSIDNLTNLKLLSPIQFKETFNIDLSKKTILITFHPETVSFDKNEEYVGELVRALGLLPTYQLVITMPNADAMGYLIRIRLKEFIDNNSNACGIESFGTVGYLSCMKHCSFLLGNTSSGFVEASFFPKFVINIGDRQKGRIVTQNILNCPIKSEAIIAAVNRIENSSLPDSIDIYGNGRTAEKIVETLKAIK